MPWCPKCKNEYRNGITVCADCKEALVENLSKDSDLVNVAGLESKELADRLVKYYHSQNIESILNYSEEDNGYVISVHENERKKALKLFQAFYEVEAENKANEESDMSETELFTDEEDFDFEESIDDTEQEKIILNRKTAGITSAAAISYVKKADKSKDLQSTAVTFLFFGVAGIIFLVLNIFGVITLIDNLLSFFVMGIMFIGCLFISYTSNRDAKKAKQEAVLEEELTKKLNVWLSANITESVLASFEEDGSSEEINFMSKIEGMKDMITKEIGELDDAYLDSIVEEFYNSKFEKTNE